ncbi:MAG TPA: hypothetical protein VKV37_07075 [Ktedonobacteraceae bacterium]|jgi:hypothetical protein|nr:hypothetical protein [Ktedonobacteraceae bacterium]
MMPQQESDPIHEQAESTYGRYEGEQEYARQQFETPYQQPQQSAWAGKVYTAQSDNKNMLRLVAMGMALAALMAFAVICLIIVGGTAGWVSFCAACLATFIVAVVAIDKIK